MRQTSPKPLNAEALTNGQLYDAGNEIMWARLRGEKITPEQEQFLQHLEVELSVRPAEVE